MEREPCKATLLHRGVLLECEARHEWSRSAHESGGVYWRDGETERHQCTESASYCGETLRCDLDAGERQHGDCHRARSVRFGVIAWSDEKRPQPDVMFEGLCMGHRYGSHEADCLMLAASTHQDAANRLEYALVKLAELQK